jgi:hypothetical protein
VPLNSGLLATLALVAAALVIAVVLESTAPAQPASCDAARLSAGHGRIAQAQTGYLTILASEPDSPCAAA